MKKIIDRFILFVAGCANGYGNITDRLSIIQAFKLASIYLGTYRLGNNLGMLNLRVGQENRELFSTDACDYISAFDITGELCSDEANDLIPNQVSV